MSETDKEYTSNTEYIEAPEIPESVNQMSEEDLELARKIEERRLRMRRSRVRKKRRTVVLMVLTFALLFTMCGREIVRLKAENLELQQQHAELEQERDRLTEELKSVGDKEYIKEQARRQLKLLDPGEIMFIFDDGDGNTQEEPESEEEDVETSE